MGSTFGSKGSGHLRGKGTGSVHVRPNGTYCGQVDLGVIDGKRQRKTIYGKTRREVERKVRDLYRQLDEHGALPTSDPTLEKWLTTWLTSIVVRRLKPNTYRSYKTAVNEHIIPAIGKVKLSRLSVDHIDALHNYVIDTRGLSTTTARNAHRILSVAMNDAVRRGKVLRNIVSLVPAPPKDESKPRRSLTPAEAIKILVEAGKDQRLGSRWLAAFLLGTRQGERLGLRWAHLDLAAGRADLAWSLQHVDWWHGCGEETDDGWPCHYKQAARCSQRHLSIPRGMAHHQLEDNLVLLRPKSKGSIRSVALYEPLRLALIARRDQVLAERAGYTIDHDLVWCRPDGGPLDPRKDWQAWSDLLVTAGVPHVTGHETRHTTATLLLEENVDPAVIKEILGHSEIVVTQGYQHVSLELQRDALGRVGKRLELTQPN